MPNQPAEDTVLASFTLPRSLARKVEEKARMGMTNKSDIIRKALMNYLSEDERAAVLREIAMAHGSRSRYPIGQDRGVHLNEKGPTKKPQSKAAEERAKALAKAEETANKENH